MRCLHPFCPKRPAPGTWADVVESDEFGMKKAVDRAALLVELNARFAMPPAMPAIGLVPPTASPGPLKRLLSLCPCLFNQLDAAPTARAVVHFCELTLGQPITSANAHQAFMVQHPAHPMFAPGPVKQSGNGGAIMEMLCSEVLSNTGMPVMEVDKSRWPVWQMPGHVLLNEGKMSALKAFGDILVPCAPTNLVISVKSEVARERLLYSSNAIEGVGFGFFKEPEEFWTDSRMALYKRMGFSVIYMPNATHQAVMDHVNAEGTQRHAVNINGTDLYRPLTVFGADMLRVVGKSSMLL